MGGSCWRGYQLSLTVICLLVVACAAKDDFTTGTAPIAEGTGEASNANLPAVTSGTTDPNATAATTLRLAKATYRDKTLGYVVGQIGGFLSGYEFATGDANALPDAWFALADGPYAGNFNYFVPPSPGTYSRLLAPGRVRGQDNYFMDFLNQAILRDGGLIPSYRFLQQAYLSYHVSDYGGSGVASKLMLQAGMQPAQTGEQEFNDAAWCCEPYIETDTLGLVAPGMPRVAYTLADRFARVSGTFDTTLWSHFMATLASVAYRHDDVRDAVAEAAQVLPAGSWPAQVYAKVLAAYARDPNDWRGAHAELIGSRRWLYGSDNDQVIADINQGTVLLALLFGHNDYVQSLKIAAIGGNEGADNAAGVGGVMGAIVGLAGLPEAFLTAV